MRYHKELLHKETFVEIPNEVKLKIIRDYLSRTYYWTIGILSFIIGLLVGISI